MARASAWLALVFGLLQISFTLYGSFRGKAAFDAPLYLDVYQVLPGILCVAGGAVVVTRVKPGLRLLSAAWAYFIGTVLVRMAEQIVQHEAAKQNGPISTKVGEPVFEPVFPIQLLQQNTLVLICAVIGLSLALLARRPNHKS
ncbi:MAG: hypothetical protein AAF221_14435 [Pseudomonadota bacterium]